MKTPDGADPRQPSEDPLASLGAEDFSGHTAFKNLSAEEKLLWLAHAAAFALEARQRREPRQRRERGGGG